MKQKSITVNFIMNALLQMSAFIFPLITFPYVSRVLLPVGTGKVSFATSVVTYFAMFAQLGIPTYGIRACARVRDNKEELTRTVHEILMINIIMSCFAYVIFGGALTFIPRMREEKVLFLIIGSTIFFNAIGMEWLYKGLEQYTYITIRSLIFKAIGVLAMFALVHEQSDYPIYGGITIFAAVGSNIFNLINVHKYVSLKPIGNYNLKRHIKAILTFFGMSVATTIYTNLDTAMLGFIKTDEAVGYYNAAIRIKTILVSIVTSLGTVLLPRATYYIEQGLKDEFLKITKKALNFVLVVATPMMLYFILFAYEGITFLSGEAYGASVLPMRIIMPTLLFIGMSNILGIQMLVPLGKEKVVLHSEIAGAIVDLLINAILIPQYGAAGAAVACVSAEFVVWMYQLFALRDLVMDSYRKMSYGKVGIALAVSSLLTIWMKNMSVVDSVVWNCFFILLFSAVTFFVVYFLILYVWKEPFVRDFLDSIIGKLLKKRTNK